MTLEIITADELAPLRHGFFTRRGGASSGIFSGLNCGFGSSDQVAIVAINRGRVADAMQVPPAAMVSVAQVHSADVLTLTGPPPAVMRSDPPASPPRADAMVTRVAGVALAVLTADCAPVLLADRTAGVIGAAHAGWRGALGGVLEATLAAMETLGARRADIAAAVGPTISQRAYEVGPEFFDTFAAADRDHARFFAGGNGDRLQFDLPGFVLHRLLAAGTGSAIWTGHCTYSDALRFYSYRRSVHAGEADYGRLISAIRL